MKKMKKSTKSIMIIFGILFVILAIIYAGVSVYFSTRFFPGTVINGIDVSAKTVEDAEQMVANEVQDYTIILMGKDETVGEIAGAEMGFEYISDGVIQDLLDVQQPMLWITAYFTEDSYKMTTTTTYNKELLKEAMLSLDFFAEDKVTEPADAYIEETSAGFELISEVEGNKLDEDKVFEQLTQAVDAGATELDLEATECYIKPEITTANEELQNQYNALKKYQDMTITYNLCDGQQEVLDSTTILQWMTVAEDGEVSFDWNYAADWMSELSQTHDTYGKDMQFTTTNGETITVSRVSYGWKIDQESEVNALLEILAAGESVTGREPIYLQTAMSSGSDDIGDTYIEIDYVNQHMWYYKNGSLLVDTKVVTGNTSKDMASPDGVYYIYNKETNAILKGEDYKTPVDFWMPYYGGVGIHDAKWRTGGFGGKIYQTGGSHGCVNTPWANAQTIFENVEIGVPVICYNNVTDRNEPVEVYEQPAETRNVEEELKTSGEETEES